MGIRSMPWDEWIELDRELPKYHKVKCHRINTRGEDAVRVLDDRTLNNDNDGQEIVRIKNGRAAGE